MPVTVQSWLWHQKDSTLDPKYVINGFFHWLVCSSLGLYLVRQRLSTPWKGKDMLTNIQSVVIT